MPAFGDGPGCPKRNSKFPCRPAYATRPGGEVEKNSRLFAGISAGFPRSKGLAHWCYTQSTLEGSRTLPTSPTIRETYIALEAYNASKLSLTGFLQALRIGQRSSGTRSMAFTFTSLRQVSSLMCASIASPCSTCRGTSVIFPNPETLGRQSRNVTLEPGPMAKSSRPKGSTLRLERTCGNGAARTQSCPGFPGLELPLEGEKLPPHAHTLAFAKSPFFVVQDSVFGIKNRASLCGTRFL